MTAQDHFTTDMIGCVVEITITEEILRGGPEPKLITTKVVGTLTSYSEIQSRTDDSVEIKYRLNDTSYRLMGKYTVEIMHYSLTTQLAMVLEQFDRDLHNTLQNFSGLNR